MDIHGPLLAAKVPKVIRTGVNELLGWLSWAAVAACVAGIILVAFTMATRHHSGGEVPLQQLGWVLVACVILSSTAAIVKAVIFQ